MGEVTEGERKKLSNIRAPMEGGKLMCEVEAEDARDGLVRLDRSGSAPAGEVDGNVAREVGEVVREVRLESAPDGEVGTDEVRGSAPGRPDAGRAGRGPNRARRVNA